MFRKSSSIEFSTSDDPRKVMETVQERGAAVIHDYIPAETIAHLVDELSAEPMELDEDLESKVKRRQEMVKYALLGDPLASPLEGNVRRAPLWLETEARGIANYISKDGGQEYHPNEIMGHLYRTNYFIDPHRDLTSAIRFIVSATISGRQKLYMKLDGERRWTMVQNEEGKVVIMRGYDGVDPDRRPLHRVDIPEVPRRAFTMREVGKLAASSTHWDVKKEASAVW